MEEKHAAASQEPARIRPLAPDVVSKIAAGEIIIHPAQGLKELLENSIDAGAKNVSVTVQDGGLKLLQITDDGCGINKDDLAVLCERFTTSKLTTFEDLKSIATYGFRGEALASLSHVSRLTVTTATAGSSGAWRASYQNGRMMPAHPGSDRAEPVLVAGNKGTTIKIEDLFYNLPSRLTAISSSAGAARRELGRVVDILSQYSVHFQDVGITCKKVGVRDPALAISSATKGSRRRLAAVYDVSLQNLVQVRRGEREEDDVEGEGKKELTDDYVKTVGDRVAAKLGYSVAGWVSSANHVSKKGPHVLLFVNHRAVECSAIRRAVLQLYSSILPRGCHPVVYLDLQILPERVDVNVHPTKKEVHFLNEDEIVEQVCEAVAEALRSVDVSRQFMAQRLPAPGIISTPKQSTLVTSEPSSQTPSTPAPSSTPSRMGVPLIGSLPVDDSEPIKNVPSLSSFISSSPSTPSSRSWSTPKPRSDRTLVRTDYRTQKITAMLSPMPQNVSTPTPPARADRQTDRPESDPDYAGGEEQPVERPSAKESQQDQNVVLVDEAAASKLIQDAGTAEYRPCRLTSIHALRAKVKATVSEGVTNIFASHTFVGISDAYRRLAVIQSGTKIYNVDYGIVGKQFFYQLGLDGFGNFGRIWWGQSRAGRVKGGSGDAMDVDGGEAEVEVGLDIDELLDLGVRYEKAAAELKARSGPAGADSGGAPGLVDWDVQKKKVKKLLMSRREMLADYFSILIDVVPAAEPAEGDSEPAAPKLVLRTTPVLLRNYIPAPAKLPIFLIRLATAVRWDSEMPCFDGLLRHLADFYVPERIPPAAAVTARPPAAGASASDGEGSARPPSEGATVVAGMVEKALFPSLKLRFAAGQEVAAALMEIADLKNMYRVFERC